MLRLGSTFHPRLVHGRSAVAEGSILTRRGDAKATSRIVPAAGSMNPIPNNMNPVPCILLNAYISYPV